MVRGRTASPTRRVDAGGSAGRRGRGGDTEFRHAIAIARQQEAKLWELRSAVSLARLWRNQDKVDEARGLLVPVDGWFNQGFDIRDLKESKALLEYLWA